MRSPKIEAFRRWAPAALLAAALLAPAAAAQSPARGGSTDAATYAEMMGVPLAEAKRRLALQLELGKLEIELRARAGESFAGLWIEHRPSFSVQVRFTDPAAGERLLRAIAPRGLGAEVVVGAADASLSELERLQEESLRLLRAAKIAVDADIDVRANRVEISAVAPEDAARQLAASPSLAAGRLEIVPVTALAQPFQAYSLRGGRPISGCSSGFTARTTAGTVGVLTAGHCNDPQTDADSGETLDYVAGQLSGSRDVQFNRRSCQMTVPDEFDSGTGIRSVSGTLSRDQQVVGSMVCRYGKTTPQRCGLIHSKNVCPSYVASCSSTFMRIASTNGAAIATFGDSGGPVFFDTLAYGLLSGGYPSSPDAIYMAINYASTVANVLTFDGGTGFVTATMSCSGVWNGSTMISCIPAVSGGNPPYTFANWFYNGAADSWSTYFNSIRAHYLSPGCPGGANNYFSVTIADQCGSPAGANAWAPCPVGCPAGQVSQADPAGLLPPTCTALPAE